jgi:DNA-binding transcriptional LysR family regulator
VFAGLAVSILPRCAVTPGMRRIGPQEGLPALPTLDLVLHRRPSGVTEAAERFAEYVAAKLRDVVPFRPVRLAGEYAKGDPRRAAEM